MFKFFSRKPEPEKGDLEKARDQNLITEKEFLELKIERAKAKLEALNKKEK